MALSIVEIILYGGITYFCLGLILVSIFQKNEISNNLGGLRVAFLTIGVISAFMMSGSTDEIFYYENVKITDFQTTSNVTGETWTENGTETNTNKIILQNPTWVSFHIMIAFAIIIYILIETVSILRNMK